MTHNIFWWNCKHIEVDNNLGVAFCTKNNDFCNKSKCTEIQGNPKKQYYRERMEELQNENERLKQSYQLLADMCDEYKELKDSLENENEWLKKENKEIRQDNDIKFWKLQCMRQHNSTQVILHEVSLAIKKGYEVSDEFKKYIDDLEENNKKMIEKNKRLFGDSDD